MTDCHWPAIQPISKALLERPRLGNSLKVNIPFLTAMVPKLGFRLSDIRCTNLLLAWKDITSVLQHSAERPSKPPDRSDPVNDENRMEHAIFGGDHMVRQELHKSGEKPFSSFLSKVVSCHFSNVASQRASSPSAAPPTSDCGDMQFGRMVAIIGVVLNHGVAVGTGFDFKRYPTCYECVYTGRPVWS